MQFLWSLFAPRHKYRNFAMLDQQGVCLAFKRCCLSPGDNWVEVEEICLGWLHKPLPSSARVIPSDAKSISMQSTHARGRH